MNKNLLSVDEALEILLSHSKVVSELEEIPTLEATNRVLARAQRSTMDVPPMDNSAMDGYAVRTSDGGRLRVAQKIMAGSTGKPLEPGTAARIFTGAPIPPGADAVVMQEHCEVRGDEVLIKSPTLGAFLISTSSPRTSQCSCITTASAPGGIGAPVKIRAAVDRKSVV